MFALRRDSSKARFCVVGIFYFVNSRKGPFAGWNVSGRDYRFLAQNSRISHFQCGHLPKHSSVNSAPHGTSSRIADWGLVLGLSTPSGTVCGFLTGSSGTEKALLFANSQDPNLASRASSAIMISWLVTGLVTVNGNRKQADDLGSLMIRREKDRRGTSASLTPTLGSRVMGRLR